MIEKGNFRKRELEAEKNLIQTQIKEIIAQIDAKVQDLFWLRISLEKCVLSEELKMLSLNRDLGIRDKLAREQDRVASNILRRFMHTGIILTDLRTRVGEFIK